MKINRTEIMRLAALPDDLLWAEIVRIASGYGIALPTSVPPHSEMEKLREAVTGSKINMGDAMRLLNTYRRGSQK